MEDKTLAQSLPPQNIEAEVAVLGAILISYKEALPVALELLTPESFYSEIHRYIFKAMEELYNDSNAVDTITVASKLTQMNKIEAVGGSFYITGLCDTALVSNVEHHINIITECANLRKLIILGREVEAKAYGRKSSDDISNDLISKLFKIDTNMGELIVGDNILVERKKGLIKLLQGFSWGTGYRTIDRFLSFGFAPEQISVITARPSIGKSAFKENISLWQAGNGAKILQISPEQGFNREMNRFCAINTQMPLQQIIKMSNWADVVNGKIVPKSDEGRRKLKIVREQAERMKFLNMSFEGGGVISLGRIRRLILDAKNKDGLDIVYIDLLDRVKEINTEVNKKPQAISKAMGTLSNIAKEAKVHICALAQLNRGVEKRKDKRPMMSDLKESGAYEEYADLIIGLYREGFYNEEIYDNEMDVIIIKQRDGSTGTIKMNWFKETITITDMDEEAGLENMGIL